jgi:hypothetical protein
MALVRLSTNLSIPASSTDSVLNGTTLSRHDWNLYQSVRLKSGRSGGLRKDDRYVVSISMGK